MIGKRRTVALCLLFLLAPLPSSAETVGPTAEISVVRGDTLIGICKRLLEDPRRWRDVAVFNRLRNPDSIYPRQRILIPLRLMRGEEAVATVTLVRGEATARRAKSASWEPLLLGASLGEGSAVSTGDDAGLELAFEDGSTILSRGLTDFEIEKARRKSPILFYHRLYLETGRIISRVKTALGIESRHEIRMPSAITGVRGTEFRTSVGERDKTSAEVLRGIVTVEAMKAKVNVREGEGTVVESGRPPRPPSPLLPPPLLIDAKPLYRSLPIILSFKDVSGAVSRRVTLATDEGMRDVLWDAVVKAGDQAEITGLDDGTYYLQATSIDAVGLEGMPNEPATVTVRLNPVPPSLRHPREGAELIDRSVTFQWLKVPDAAAYHLQVVEDPDFTKLTKEVTDLRETECEAELPDFKTYHYRVRSIAGDGFAGLWSDGVPFSIIPPPPAPSVEKPSVGEEDITVRWRSLGNGVTYRVQVAKDEEFRGILEDTKVDKPEISFKRPDAGTYYVRTAGIDASGREGTFSAAQTLEIERRFPYGLLGVIGAIGMFLLIAL
jgi:hypothetical protein